MGCINSKSKENIGLPEEQHSFEEVGPFARSPEIYEWNHGMISAEEATRRVADVGRNGTFLVRTQPVPGGTAYVITVLFKVLVAHFRLDRGDGRWLLCSDNKKHKLPTDLTGLQEVVSHLSMNQEILPCVLRAPASKPQTQDFTSDEHEPDHESRDESEFGEDGNYEQTDLDGNGTYYSTDFDHGGPDRAVYASMADYDDEDGNYDNLNEHKGKKKNNSDGHYAALTKNPGFNPLPRKFKQNTDDDDHYNILNNQGKQKEYDALGEKPKRPWHQQLEQQKKGNDSSDGYHSIDDIHQRRTPRTRVVPQSPNNTSKEIDRFGANSSTRNRTDSNASATLHYCGNYKSSSNPSGCSEQETLKKRFMVCGGCKAVLYCSATCQNAHWYREHKNECGKGKVSTPVKTQTKPAPADNHHPQMYTNDVMFSRNEVTKRNEDPNQARRKQSSRTAAQAGGNRSNGHRASNRSHVSHTSQASHTSHNSRHRTPHDINRKQSNHRGHPTQQQAKRTSSRHTEKTQQTAVNARLQKQIGSRHGQPDRQSQQTNSSYMNMSFSDFQGIPKQESRRKHSVVIDKNDPLDSETKL
eukprot:m.336797 g.336797  ORF g.336797 m.336797 type:complete len:582 (+) comp17964_c0_seq1:219-1964(+)